MREREREQILEEREREGGQERTYIRKLLDKETH